MLVIKYGPRDFSYEKDSGKHGSILMKFTMTDDGIECEVGSDMSPMMLVAGIETLKQMLEQEHRKFVEDTIGEMVGDIFGEVRRH